MAARMRFTIVDETGTISFIGPYHALKVLAAACSQSPAPADHRLLIALAGAYDQRFARTVLAGLAVFDEHITPDDAATIRARLTARDDVEIPPFRVVDEVTRRYSLEPVKAGLVVFNLPARRIVQVCNSLGGLRRSDRGRIRRESGPTGEIYRYELPGGWTIVP